MYSISCPHPFLLHILRKTADFPLNPSFTVWTLIFVQKQQTATKNTFILHSDLANQYSEISPVHYGEGVIMAIPVNIF
ncbi:hypothetical protein QQF64_005716 [Cirrhinus molitorella]|uniref:Uncharacterized protein n=1 Tax=Cirrhinus molitorella TaxID=172907 RepID=A0ABR3MGE1_9TELE